MHARMVLVGQKRRVVFAGGSFGKGVRVPVGVLGKRFVWGRVQVGAWEWVSCRR